MKKLFAFLLTLAFSCLLLAGCVQRTTDEIRIYMPDGAPALAYAELLNAAKAGDDSVTDNKTFSDYGYTLNYSLVAESALAATVANGDADIAIMPTNAAATVFNKGARIKSVSVNVHGLLYMVGKPKDGEAPATELADLKGKVVYSIGQTGTPGFVFQYLLGEAGIEFEVGSEPVEGKVVINYVTEGPAVIAALNGGMAEYGILGEPAVSQAIAKTGSKLVFDLQSEWNRATNGLELPQACMVVKESLLESDPAFIDALIEKLAGNDTWIVNHPDLATQALVKLGSTTAQGTTFTAEIIERCNIKTVSMKDSLEAVEKYLLYLFNFNAASVGGDLPTQDLYYLGA